MNVRFYLSQNIKILKNHVFLRANNTILPSFMQRKNGRHYVMLLNLKTTGGLSILLHGIKHSQRRRHVIIHFLLKYCLIYYKQHHPV